MNNNKSIKVAVAAQVTALVPSFLSFPPCPPELAKPTLRPPVAR